MKRSTKEIMQDKHATIGQMLTTKDSTLRGLFARYIETLNSELAYRRRTAGRGSK